MLITLISLYLKFQMWISALSSPILSNGPLKTKWLLIYKKNMEMVFQRPNPRNIVYPAPFDGIAQVQIAKFLGVFFCRATSAVRNTSNILTVRSQSMYLLKCLKAKGLPISKLHNICQAILLYLESCVPSPPRADFCRRN